jgi:hypothetical protein
MYSPRPSRHRRPVPCASGGLFTRADALAAGWTDSALFEAVRTGRLVRLRPGVFTPATAPPADVHQAARAQLLARAAAVTSTTRDVVISHAAAAAMHGLAVLCLPDRPCLTVQAGTAMRDVAGAHLHRATLGDADVTLIDGLPATSLARTVLDVSRESGVEAGLVLADAALRAGLDADALSGALGQCARWPGGRRARAVAAMADGLAESPLESLSRLRFRQHRLPAPLLQVELGDEFGRYVRRVDHYWPQFGVAGEADGALKYDTRTVLVAEKRQQEQLEELGVVFVRWGWADIFAFESVVSRLRRAFARGIPLNGGQRWSVLSGLHLRHG